MVSFPWTQYGLIGLVVGALFFILWRLLIWVMSFVKEITKQHNEERLAWASSQKEERLSWLKVLESIKSSLDFHNQASADSRKATEEAHKYQREEHLKMLEQNNKICNCLTEVEKSLGRINGYK